MGFTAQHTGGELEKDWSPRAPIQSFSKEAALD